MLRLALATLFTCLIVISPQTKASHLSLSEKQTPPVKQSSTGICHDSSSSSYKRTKTYKPFTSLSACMAAGGRLSKSASKNMDKAIDEATDNERDFFALYDRSDWPHWSDSDKDCQNTRHELLIANSNSPVSYKNDKLCLVIIGSWHDPYSDKTFTNANELDLDHIVPLKFAHGHGGAIWSTELKEKFANDYDNLLLVQASLNRQKGAKGLAEWLPPNHQYRCAYIVKFNTVMDNYGLSYIPSEKRIINRMVAACGG
jgi:hypothetical protein